MLDVASFLRKYASSYTDIDVLYRKAESLGLVETRKEFADCLEDSFDDPGIADHIYTELPFKRHWTVIHSPKGNRIGLIKWVEKAWWKENR